MKSFMLRHGLLASILLVILSLLPWLFFKDNMSYQMGEIVGYSAMIISLSLVFFGIRHFRDEVNNGKLSFWEGLRIGSLITLIPAAVFFLYTIFYFGFFGDDFMEWAIEAQRNTMEPQAFEAYLKEIEPYKDMGLGMYVVQGLVMGVTVFAIGFIISLVSSMILKREVALEQTV